MAKHQYITQCKLCEAPIKQHRDGMYAGKGYCNDCKASVMAVWNSVPFEKRIEILKVIWSEKN